MSNPFSDRRIQRSQLLQVAEYTSTAASVVGVVVSALSQQMVYAAAPLSLSLCLSLVNRRRFKHQTEQRFNGEIAQIDQRLLHLDQRVLEQSAQSPPGRVTDLSEQLTAFQQGQNEAAIDLSELRSQLAQLQERFTTTQQGQNATAISLGELQAQLSQLNAQLTEIQERQADVAASQTGLETRFSQVRENLSQEIQDTRQQIQAANLSFDGLEALQQEFLQLAEQITSLQQRQSPTATDHAELQARLSQIDMQLTAIQERQADTEISQTGLDTNFSQVRENLSQEIQDIRQQIQATTLSLGEFNLDELQARLSQLNAQLTSIQQRQADVETSQIVLDANLSQVRENLSQEIQGIRQQIQATTLSLGEFNLDELQARLSQLSRQLTAIQERQADAEISQTGLDTNLSQVRENLSQEIQDTRQQIQAVALSLDGLEMLQQAFPRLTEQVISLQQRQSPTATDHAELQARLSQIDMQLAAIRQRQAKAETSQTTELETKVEPPPILTSPKVEVGVLSLNLGIDFGTSFTKVCFRDVSTDRSEIVTFTDEITHLEEALLPTKIGILPDGTLITGLTASEWKPYENQVQTTVEFIKMRLANFDLPQDAGSWQLEKLSGVSSAEIIENLCAYYLSRVITRAQAWIRHNKPELIINQKIDWSANVGVPVEYCDSKAIKRFERVLSLAWLLSNEPQTEQMTVENLRDRMKPLRATLEETAIDCHAIPEIAAEAWALINSLEVDEGFYVLFDVGDGTLDGSSFRYWNENGERKVDFYFAKVNSLGVTAFSQRLAQELGIAETDVKNTICGNSTHYLNQFQTSTARREIQELVANVVWNGSQRYVKHGFRLTWRGFEKPLEVLIGGGGGQTSFYTQAIIDKAIFEQMLEANKPLIRALRSLWSHPPNFRAAKRDLDRALQSDYFRHNSVLRQIQHTLETPGTIDAETQGRLGYKLENASLVSQYLTRSRKRDVLPNRVERAPQTLAVPFSALEKEIYESVTQAICKQSKGKQGVSLFRLIARQRQMASCLVAALRTWSEQGILDEFQDELFWELGISTTQLEAEILPDRETLPLENINYAQLEFEDTKYRSLVQFLRRELKKNPDEQFVLFAYFRGTLHYLQRRLEADGIQVSLILGGMGDRKQEVLAQFKQGKTSILLSSEVGSEGIDLQFCRFLINYDLPWNPMRVEQRIGRIDRLGQKADRISIINFSLVDTIEERILERLYERINVFQESIGDLENILGEATEKLLITLFEPELTDAERLKRADETASAILKQRLEQDQLEQEAVNLMAFSDQILHAVTKSRNQGRWLTSEELHSFVEDYFARYYLGTTIKPIPGKESVFEIKLTEDAKIDLDLFLKQHRFATQTRLHRSPALCLFDPRLAVQPDKDKGKPIELLDPTHPLIQWIRHSYDNDAQIHPIAAICCEQSDVEVATGQYVYVIHRWLFKGLRSESRLAYKVARYSDGKLLSDDQSERFAYRVARCGKAKLNAANLLEDLDRVLALYSDCDDALEAAFDEASTEFTAENDNRCNIQERSAESYADRRRQQLEDRIQTFQQSGKLRMLPATEGQLRKVIRELEIKKKMIIDRRNTELNVIQLAAGMIFVNS